MQLGDGDEAVYSELPLVGRVSRLLLRSGCVFSLGLGLFFFFVTGYATTHTLSFPRVVSNVTSHAISQCYPNLILPYIYLQSVAVALNIPDLQKAPSQSDHEGFQICREKYRIQTRDQREASHSVQTQGYNLFLLYI